jgi:hypothetical protein
MKKLVLTLAVALAVSPALFAQVQAVLKEMKGTVEIKAEGGVWKAARIGARLDKGSFISTGFSSTAVLEVGPSTLRVSPLTRMQLAELVARQGTLSTALILKVGKVNAVVKSSEGMRTDFTLKAPATTAAVRGTEFEFDGVTVKVVNGVVLFSNSLGQARGVAEGEQSSSGGTQLPTTGDQEKDAQVSVVPYTGPTGGGMVPTLVQELPAAVTIKWQ